MFSHKVKHVFSFRQYLANYLLYTNRCRYAIPASRNLVEETKKVYEHFKVDHVYHGFLVKRIELIPEFSIQAVHLIHEQSNAQYLHLFREDSNNVFSINFRTTPLDSTGLPHILEHIVLCGSSLYPVRDPFFKMINRSLATFMNAMTGPDYTMYPFSTTNITDYKNLQSVYLDAAFKPNLRLQDFMQEGWRLEHTNLDNPKSELVIKGVVYNEMKGCFAENERLFSQQLLNSILPDHTYGVISGGDPLRIPLLTWEDLKEFHQQHYHPSNCRFYSYGNFPLMPTLELLNRTYLNDVQQIDISHTEVPSQKRWSKPKTKQILCRVESMGTDIDKQNTLAISYVMSDISDIYETFLLQFITELLIKGPNAPFYKSLIEPNISGGYSPSTGYDGSTKDTLFILGLQGLEKSKFNEVVQIFDDTIDKVIQIGFFHDQIESVLHSYELGIKHESQNFGLNLLFSLTPLWNHNGPIVDSLKVNSLIDKLKSNMLKHPRYLHQKVKHYFKDNKHRLILKMSPDPEWEEKIATEEKKLLKEKIENLSAQEKEEIYNLGHELQEEQSTPQNTDLLPTLKLGDINRDVTPTLLETGVYGHVPTQVCLVPTNGIIYFKSIISTAHLKDENMVMLLPFFNYVISKLGTPKYDYRTFDTLVNKKTSGLAIDTIVLENLTNINLYEKGLLISSYCLDRNFSDMLAIWSEVFKIRKLTDLKRLQMLLNSYVTNLSHGIADNGHMYALRAANGLISGPAHQKEIYGGLSHIEYMKNLMVGMDHEKLAWLLNQMVRIAEAVFVKDNMRTAFNCSPDSKDVILTEYEKFLRDLPLTQLQNKPNQITWMQKDVFSSSSQTLCKHNVFNIPVNFCARSIKTVPYVDEKFAALKVLSKLLSSKYLHPIVREKNGAYGGGARLDYDGLFGFFSYRDPNNLKTLDTFTESHQFLVETLPKFTDQDIFEAKLGLFQSIDAPIIPENRGNRLFYYGLTDKILQKHRRQILDVKKQDLKRVADDFLANNNVHLTANVVLGPKMPDFNAASRPTETWTFKDCD